MIVGTQTMCIKGGGGGIDGSPCSIEPLDIFQRSADSLIIKQADKCFLISERQLVWEAVLRALASLSPKAGRWTLTTQSFAGLPCLWFCK